MANQVEIFNINFGDTVQSIEKLKAELKETRKLFEQAKPNTEDFVKYSTEVKRLDGTIKTLNGITKEQTNALGGINTAAKFATGSYGELKQSISSHTKALLDLNVNSKEFADTQEELIKLQSQRIEIEKKIPSLFQERIKGAIDESNSLKQLKIDLKAAQSAALNGDGAAAQKVAELKDKIDDLKDSTQSLQGSGVERLNTSMGLLTQGFQDFDMDKVKTGFKGIGAAMSAIPIILIIEGIKALIENFDVVVKFAKEMTGSFSAAEKAVTALTLSTAKDSAVNKVLINQYTNEIALLSAKGGHEKELTELKKKKLLVEIAEAENILRLNVAKIVEKNANNSITDSINNVTVALFRKIGADETANKAEAVFGAARKKRIQEDTAEELKLAQDAAQQISAAKTSIQVLDIEYNKKQQEKAKENSQKAIDNEKTKNQKLTEEHNKYLKQQEEDDKAAADLQASLTEKLTQVQLKFLKQLDDARQQSLDDDVARAKTKVMTDQQNGWDYLAAREELMKAELERELANTELSEAEKLEIKTRYAQDEQNMKLQQDANEIQAASNMVSSLGDLSDGLFALKRANLVKGSAEDKAAAEQQFKVNKAVSVATAILNGASAVMNALGTVQPYYLAVAAAIGAGVTSAAQVAKISATKFQYFEGGYTESGNPHEESYSMGNKQFHKSEYVIPAKVLSTPKGSLLAAHAESMRKGSGNLVSGIGGFFDGGYTNRSASNASETSAMNQKNIMQFIEAIPAPVVKVTDINKLNISNSQTVNVSSL